MYPAAMPPLTFIFVTQINIHPWPNTLVMVLTQLSPNSYHHTQIYIAPHSHTCFSPCTGTWLGVIPNQVPFQSGPEVPQVFPLWGHATLKALTAIASCLLPGRRKWRALENSLSAHVYRVRQNYGNQCLMERYKFISLNAINLTRG